MAKRKTTKAKAKPVKFKIQRYGWRPSHPDHRDFLYAPRKTRAILPGAVDLRPNDCPIYDQGNLGSCTANAIGGLYQFLCKKEGKLSVTPSRLFIYWNERNMEGTVNTDSGAMIRDGFKVVSTLGNPAETLWPYTVSKFRTKPPISVYNAGKLHLISQYMAVDNTNLTTMKTCLASGFPVVGGFSVYQSFESQQVANTGLVPMPGQNEQMIGGHAIEVVGYDDGMKAPDGVKGMYIVRNSWGTGWGARGYFYMPYRYFGNAQLASDWWTARLAS